MPRLTFRNNRRSLEVSLRQFEREYPRAVLEQVAGVWGRQDVLPAIRRQTRNPRNRTGNMRRQMRAVHTQGSGGDIVVRFHSNARSPQGFPYWIVQERGSRTGVPATRFIRRAVRQARPQLERRLRDETRRQVRRAF